jgi:non-ribosomal peptide synthetase component F
LFARDLPDINFPTDFPRSRIQSFEGRSVEFQLGGKESNALKELSLRNEVTLFMLLLSLFKIFLAKVSKMEDIVVGIPMAQRGHAHLEQIIGIFASTIALRTYPEKEKTFKEFLFEVKESMLAAFENQDYSLDHLMNSSSLSLNRNRERSSMFDVMFDVHELGSVGHSSELETTRFSRQTYENRRKEAKIGLTLVCYNKYDALFFEFLYFIDLYKHSTIERFAGYLKDIINSVLENEDFKLKDIEIKSDLVASQSILQEEDISDFGF